MNPLIVEGQVHGGLAQGIAQALYEEAVYDADGNLTTGTFVDYLVPSAADLPHFDTGNTVHPAPGNPIGAKGVGEAGCIASTPAVVNAALDAVRHLGCPTSSCRSRPNGSGGPSIRAVTAAVARQPAPPPTAAPRPRPPPGESTDASSLGGDR